MRILLIEDELNLGAAVREHLAVAGHAVDWFQDLESGGHAMRTVAYELLLLDLVLPDGRGLDFLKRIRQGGSVLPVIILTARDQISDRISGLKCGADDYLVKPFDLDELLARIDAVARRYGGNPNPLIEIGPLLIDLASRRITTNGKTIDLTSREWGVLDRLLRHPGATVSKPQLEETLYAFGAEIESNAVEVYIGRLRKKLGPERIHTIRGVGYRCEV